MLNDLYKVLRAYDIIPLEINNVTDRLYYIRDHHNDYALKKSKLTKAKAELWKNIYHQAHVYNMRYVLPIYLTKKGQLFHEADDAIYYVMPWVETDEVIIEQFYKSIGNLHIKTRQTYSIPKEKLAQAFTTYKRQMDERKKYLLSVVEQFEQRRFMSPFELMVCTHFNILDTSLSYLERHLDYFTVMEDEYLPWNISLCHGNLDPAHILQRDHVYFINWESANWNNGIFDLVHYFRNQPLYYDTNPETPIAHFDKYMEENKLLPGELHLMAIYLLDPEPYFTVIENYLHPVENISMVEQMIKLEQHYRHFVFGLHFSDYAAKQETDEMDDWESLES